MMIGALELREKVIVRLATWEGMRPGEILALQLGDLNDDSVWVRRRVYKGDIDEPKTKRSTRRVALTVGTLGLLDQWKLRLLGSPAEPWLFGSEKGTPMRRDNIWRKCMYPKLKPVGLEWATFSGHAADVRNVVEGCWGGCSYPFSTDGQYGGCE